MLLWTLIALMTGAAALAMLWPLQHGGAAAARSLGDVAVYRDQLREVERDRERGLIGAPEAEAARLEVSRRLLAADAEARQGTGARPSPIRRRAAATAVLAVVPLMALGLYARIGSPTLPDEPLSARLDAPLGTAPLDVLVARVEQRLAEHPEDGRGWELLAPVYLKAGRADDARAAYAKAIAFLGSTPEREAGLGDAIVAAAGGVVTADAKAAFQRALKGKPDLDEARYYLALAREQDGDKAGAVADWRAMLSARALDPREAEFLRRQIARASGVPEPAAPSTAAAPAVGTPGGPSDAQVAAADSMAPAERTAMIQGMVDGLAAKLRQDGSDADGWLRLVRAYAVLGERDKAVAAAGQARAALAGRADAVQAVDGLVAELGLPHLGGTSPQLGGAGPQLGGTQTTGATP